MDISDLGKRVVRSAPPRPSCPGGVGNFGFNSYDLLTFGLLVMGAVSSAVIVNTNKNENNDNNNDLQASLGQINTNTQMASADQTSTNMAMIIVPPSGTPIVIPGGRLLSNGLVNLTVGAEIPGVSWLNDDVQVFDDGRIIHRYANGTVERQSRGVVAFGTVDNRNVFHLLPSHKGRPADWTLLRSMAVQGSRDDKKAPPYNGSSPVIPFDGAPVFVPTSDIDLLYAEAIRVHGSTLIQIALPPIGPPIIVPIGALLDDGNVLLNDGVDVEGVYWESPDRALFDNGTIVYKVTKVVETAQIGYGTINPQGVVSLLPKIGKQKTNIRLLRSLNVKSPTSAVAAVTLDPDLHDSHFWDTLRGGLSENADNGSTIAARRKRGVMSPPISGKQIHFAFSTVSLLEEMGIKDFDKLADVVMCSLFVNHHNALVEWISRHKPNYTCLAHSVVNFCYFKK
jgi:hypothetical protein